MTDDSQMPTDPHRVFALDVVRQLREAGFTAYFAGGCVRDELLGLVPQDYDVATDAVPAAVQQVFGRRRSLPIGASFGVITVIGPKGTKPIEVATFRSDGQYSDGRHPDSVVFSSAEEDAARRDFTINGMFFDPLTDSVIDYVGGRDDLRQGQVRAIGDPLERIGEDRLRMLRAVRFASTYGFDLAEETFAAVCAQAQHITQVSQERITGELNRMLCHLRRADAADLLMRTGLFPLVLPLLADVATGGPSWTRVLRLLEQYDRPNFGLVLATLFLELEIALDARRVDVECRRMRLSNESRQLCRQLVAQAASWKRACELPFSELQPLLVSESARPAVAYLEALAQVDGNETVSRSHARCAELLTWSTERLDPPPLLGGQDLVAMGLPPGPLFRLILDRVRAAQLDGELPTVAAARELAAQLAEQMPLPGDEDPTP